MRLPRDPATVDDEEMADDEPGLIGTEEQDSRCQFLGLAHPADRKQAPYFFRRDILLFHPLMENVAGRVG